ncbi:MAG: glycosyltransferase family 39 protein [Candidatus Aenigmatarchaeota archaeon]
MQSDKSKKNRYKNLLHDYGFLAIIFMLYIVSYGLHFNGLQPDWPARCDNYYGLTQSIVERGTIDRNYEFEACRNNVTSFNCTNAGQLSFGTNGNVYSKLPPGLSFIGVPVYYAAYAMGYYRPMRMASLFLLNTLMSMGILFFIYEIAKMRTDRKNAMKITCVFAFGTIIYTYSQTLAADVLAAFLVTSSFFFFLKFTQRKNKYIYAFLSGLPLGYIFMTKPPLLVVAGIFLVAHAYLSLKRRDVKNTAAFALGFAVLFLVGCMYYQTAFGGIFRTGYENVIKTETIASGTIETYNELERFSNNPLIQAPAILLGMLIVSPFIVFAWSGRKNIEMMVIWLTVLSSAIVFGTFYSPFGALFGPRHELFLFPLLSLPLAENFNVMVKDNKKMRVFWLLVIVSVAINVIGCLNFAAWDVWIGFESAISAVAKFR